ncbi:MAG: hypothetical protein KDK23_04505 [Leptospiraceae bacterium]|nr:hypothetical protein [Leptospiraceae bacterium]
MIVSRDRISSRARNASDADPSLIRGTGVREKEARLKRISYPDRQTGGHSSPLLFSSTERPGAERSQAPTSSERIATSYSSTGIRLITFVLLLGLSPFVALRAESNEQNPASSSSLSIAYGPALWGAGSILDGAGNDLELLAGFINTGVLYEPTYTPIIQQVGPVYPVPSFELRSDNVALNYQSAEINHWSWGISFRYLNVWGKAEVPTTFLQLDRFVPISGFYPTTEGTRSWFLLATSYALDATLAYHFYPGESVDPYVQMSAGVGYGFLGEVESNPWLLEYHGALSLGLRYNMSSSYYLYTEAYFVGHWAVTKPRTNPIDFTEVLINPEKGSLYMIRLYFGAGFRLN